MRLGVTGHRSFSAPTEAQEQTCITMISLSECVYTGMALGFDTYIADLCYMYGVPFVACLPFTGQEALWSDADKSHYHTLLRAAKEIVIVEGSGYAKWKYLKRNEYIVNTTDMMLAYWDGKPSGGTYHCVSYAKTRGKEVINVY